MAFDAGTAHAAYILSIDQPIQAAAQLKALFSGIQQQAAQVGRVGTGGSAGALPGPDPQASVGIQQYITSLRQVATAAQAASSPLAQFIADIREQGAALGKTEEQINAHFAALSREALAVGDLTRALELEDAANGEEGRAQEQGTAKSLARVQAETRASLAARDYAGAARGLATELQSQGERSIAVINAERQLIQIENQAAAAAQKQAREVQHAADAELRLAQVTARGQAAAGNKVGALQTLTTAQASVVGASDRARASVDAQAAALERSGTIAGQFKQQLLGIVGPAALVAGGFALARGAIQSFGDAFKFKAELDETNIAIGIQLRGVRDVSQAFEEARGFASKYKLTQSELSGAISDSLPVIRASKSSMDDILSVFTRLTILKPGKTFNDASRAIAELQSGNAVSLERIFNVPLDKANKLKEEIKGGADAIQVLSRFLTESGVGAAALEARTRGAAGAMRDAAIAAERLQLAEARFAQGPGIAITKGKAAGLDTLTADLSGQGDLAAANRTFLSTLLKTGDVSAAFDARANALNLTIGEQAGLFDEDRQAIGRTQIANEASRDVEDRRVRSLLSLSTAHQAAAQAIRDQTKEIDASSQKSVVDAAAKDAQQQKTALLAAQTKQGVDAFLALNPKIDESGILALVAAGRLSAETGQIALLRIQAQGATNDLITLNNAQRQSAVDRVVETNRFFGRESGRGGGSDASADALAFVGVLKTQNAEQEKLLDSEIALAGARKQTGRQIDLLRQKQAQFAKGTTEFNTIEAQIIGIQTAGGRKRIDAAASTALQLNNVEENSQLQLAKTQREGLERLRDQQEDFDLRRVRSQEDEDRKIRRLLAGGQIAAAKREREDFALEQKRAREDFDRERRRTLRNNQEGLGDIGARTDLRQTQIGARAALRNGGATLGSIPPPTTETGLAPAGGAAGARVIQVTLPTSLVTPDGQVIANITYPFIAQRIDDDLSIELRGAALPGASQDAVAGARP